MSSSPHLLPHGAPRATTALLFAAVLLGAMGARAATHQVVTPQVRAELLAHAPAGVAAGKTLQLGLLIEHQPHWHTYWKNPGDSGLPTTMQWQLPAGFVAGDIDWPTPRKLPIGPLMNFGYEGRLLLPVPVQVPAGFSSQTLEVRLDAQWLVCKEVCIPESGQFAIRIPASGATAAHGALFAQARDAVPQELPAAQAALTVDGQSLTVAVSGLPDAWHSRRLDFLPETTGVIQNAAAVQARWQGGQWLASVPLDPQRSDSPKAMPFVLVADGQARGLRLQATVGGAWPAVGATNPPPPGAAGGPPSPPPTAASGAIGLGWSAVLALLGGMLLNLMPCVFPVLSLKLFGFASHAGDRARLLAGGLAYTAGVVLSFVALAALLLALRAGGEQLGWGFQLQSPVFVALLALLFSLIGLNLAGVFEFGNLLPSRWAGAQARHPLADSFLTGVLAVAVASPCTAPFMGASLGAAVTMPAAEALVVFAALGFGMALPYLLATAWPALARRLPRPGPWMLHFKHAMAFPMFATVVWLVWVLGQQAGIDAASALLATLVVVAFAAWALASPSLGGRARTALGALALLMLATAVTWTLPTLRTADATPAARSGDWEAWTPGRVAELTAAGQPVFVDFTAAWCVTCQYNKRTTLADASVLEAFRERRVMLLRADWTRRDDAISAELARLGRSGVPVYALYAPDATAPRLLSEVLTVAEVKAALAKLP